MKTPYDHLIEHHKLQKALSSASGILSWDQEVMMPADASDGRAEEMRALAVVIHEKATDPRLEEWLEAVDATEVTAPHIKEMQRQYDHATKLPADLVGEFSALTSRAQGIWAQARANKDYAEFAPSLKEIIKLSRERAAYLSSSEGNAYDALLDEYEPGLTSLELDGFFNALEAPLVALSEAIAQAQQSEVLNGHFPKEKQMELAHTLMENMGFSPSWSRLDLSTHPFSSGSFNDCRITTRVDESEPLGCLYSTLHEMGHALYEHNIEPDMQWLPAGVYASMGVHESQSRFVENQIGRGEAYTAWLYPKFQEALGDGGLRSADAFYKAVNIVERGFIRTEADEVHYNLHVLLRYQLERDLILGNLSVDDLEAAWNDRFKTLFGLDVPDASQGVLQDVHWSCGLFGYFPTYSLGNIYAASLTDALRQAEPKLDDHITKGDHKAWQNWMRTHVQSHGRLKPATTLIEHATQAPITVEPLITYLQEKFGKIYNL